MKRFALVQRRMLSVPVSLYHWIIMVPWFSSWHECSTWNVLGIFRVKYLFRLYNLYKSSHIFISVFIYIKNNRLTYLRSKLGWFMLSVLVRTCHLNLAPNICSKTICIVDFRPYIIYGLCTKKKLRSCSI